MPTPQIKSYSEKYKVPLAKVEEFWASAKKEYGEDWEKVSGTVKKMCQNYSKSKNESLNENLDTVMKVSAKKASEMMKSMYPTAQAKRATDEETEYRIGKEIVGTYNVLDGKLHYKFKGSGEPTNNIINALLKLKGDSK